MCALLNSEIHDRVMALALPLISAAGVELVDFKVGRHKKDVLLQFFADKPQGGITIEECAQLNRGIAEAIDQQGFLSEGYRLEFSSPGLDRPLVTDKDFLRNRHRPVRLVLKASCEGKSEWTGTIVGVTSQSVEIAAVTGPKTSLASGRKIMIPLDHIIKAVLVL